MLRNYELQIESILLIPSDGGRFEITINDQVIYSKLMTNRHLVEGEAGDLLRTYFKENP